MWDGTLHPIETAFVEPEVTALLQVDRPIVEVSDLDRAALWVDKPLTDLKSTLAHRQITRGSKQTFASKEVQGSAGFATGHLRRTAALV